MPSDGIVTPPEQIPTMHWYAVTQAFVASGLAARVGDYVVLCPGCRLLPVALMRAVGGAWRVIATAPSLDVAALLPCLNERPLPALRR
jgi:hypothetical protein